jgi:hypothetical protein
MPVIARSSTSAVTAACVLLHAGAKRRCGLRHNAAGAASRYYLCIEPRGCVALRRGEKPPGGGGVGSLTGFLEVKLTRREIPKAPTSLVIH